MGIEDYIAERKVAGGISYDGLLLADVKAIKEWFGRHAHVGVYDVVALLLRDLDTARAALKSLAGGPAQGTPAREGFMVESLNGERKLTLYSFNESLNRWGQELYVPREPYFSEARKFLYKGGLEAIPTHRLVAVISRLLEELDKAQTAMNGRAPASLATVDFKKIASLVEKHRDTVDVYERTQKEPYDRIAMQYNSSRPLAVTKKAALAIISDTLDALEDEIRAAGLSDFVGAERGGV